MCSLFVQSPRCEEEEDEEEEEDSLSPSSSLLLLHHHHYQAVSPSQERLVRLPAISVAHHDEDPRDPEEGEEEGPPTPYSLYTSLPPSMASSPRLMASATATQFVFPASSSAYQFATPTTPASCLSPNEISRFCECSLSLQHSLLFKTLFKH